MFCKNYENNNSYCELCDEVTNIWNEIEETNCYLGGMVNTQFDLQDILGDNYTQIEQRFLDMLHSPYLVDYCYIHFSNIIFGKLYNQIRFKNNHYEYYIAQIVQYLIEIFGKPDIQHNKLKTMVLKNIDIMANNIDNEENSEIVNDAKNNYKSLFGKKVDKTTVEQLVSVRTKQYIFKKKLMLKYGKCQICSLSNPSLLYGSHSKRWCDSDDFERLDVYNGLLLCAAHDDLFDKGFISFEDSGSIIISKHLDNETMIKFGITPDIKIRFENEHLKYIRYHRKNYFLDNKEKADTNKSIGT